MEPKIPEDFRKECEFWNEGDEQRTVGTLLGRLSNGYWVDREVGHRWLHCVLVPEYDRYREALELVKQELEQNPDGGQSPSNPATRERGAWNMTPEWPRDKWRLCEFWDYDPEESVIGVLRGYVPGSSFPWMDSHDAMWRHCQLLEIYRVPD